MLELRVRVSERPTAASSVLNSADVFVVFQQIQRLVFFDLPLLSDFSWITKVRQVLLERISAAFRQQTSSETDEEE